MNEHMNTPLLVILETLFPLRKAISTIEEKAIKTALQLNKGNKSKAAALLQIDYKTLLTKIKGYDIH